MNNNKPDRCHECFYENVTAMTEFPCNSCDRNSRYVHKTVYEKYNPPMDNQYDPVNKPKHYMLFPKEGIEVRDVIEKLVEKLVASRNNGLPIYTLYDADYVQLMQYLMRFMDKNGKEDLLKAQFYLDKLIEGYEHHA